MFQKIPHRLDDVQKWHRKEEDAEMQDAFPHRIVAIILKLAL